MGSRHAAHPAQGRCHGSMAERALAKAGGCCVAMCISTPSTNGARHLLRPAVIGVVMTGFH
eukprot:175674-Amphidinium_carterae.2